MSNDDAIKGALREAAKAQCRERCAFMGEPPCWQVSEEWPNPHCDEPGCCSESAAAIEAFLRALPNEDFGDDREGGRSNIAGCYDLHDLAAAAARAAQGDTR